jgi:rare lipoprotein A
VTGLSRVGILAFILGIGLAFGATKLESVYKASWYGKWHQGKLMANGKPFNMYAMTAAHKTLPLGTCVLIQNVDNGKEVAVQVTDRGPYVEGREFDLSMAAASKLGYLGKGVGNITYRILGREKKKYGVSPEGCEKIAAL